MVVPDLNSPSLAEQVQPHLELLQRLFQSEKKHQPAAPKPGLFQEDVTEIASQRPTAAGVAAAEHSQLENDLQAASETLRIIIDTIPSYVFWKNRDLTFLGCNERFAKSAGLTNAAEIVGKTDHQLAWKETADLYRADDRRVIESGIGMYNFIEPQSRPDGTSIWLETSKVPLLDPDGSVRGVLGIYNDVTARKKVEERLDESERQLRVVFETSQAGIILVDPCGVITLANQSMSELFRCPLSKLIGSPYPSFLHPQEKTIGDNLMQQLIRGEIDQVSTERHYLQADGGDFWGHLSGKRLVTSDGEFQGLVGIITDISERRRAEEARVKMLTFVESLLAQSPLAIRVFDGVSGDCLQANQAAADIAGGIIPALLGQNFRKLKSWQEAGLTKLAEEVLCQGDVKRVEARLHTSFGKQEIVDYFFSRFEVDGHPHLLVLGQDITEQKRLDEENKRISEQFLHAQKLESLGVLAGGIAHDFNNILLSISGNADLGLKRLSQDSPSAVNFKRIKNATEKAAELARQMLAYSGKGKFLVERLDLNHLLEEMLHILEVSISKKIFLHLALYRPLPPIEADATQLRQIIMNLVINASEAIGDHNGEIRISTERIELSENDLQSVGSENPLSPGFYVCLAVTDSGCGMNAETQARLFEPFFTTKFTGRGLGMAAVQGIIRGHKGTVQVFSEPGQGSTFKVLLPVTDQPAQAAAKQVPVERWQGAGSVLLVDDEEAVRNIGTEMLQELGFSVMLARDGVEALAVFAANPDIACVLLDLTMPRMDGGQCFQELRKIKPDLKVILVSGYSEQEFELKLDNDESAGFLQKPYWLSSLKEAMRKLFRTTL